MAGRGLATRASRELAWGRGALWLLGLAALVAGVGLANSGRRLPPAVAPAGSAEVVLHPFVPPGAGGYVVALDPGHGAPSNTGNRSCLCEPEERFTLRFTSLLARALSARGFAPVLLRAEGERVPYPVRLERAAQAGARALVSVHSDIRGTPSPSGWFACGVDASSPGFSVLYSDDRGPETADDAALARAFARELVDQGFAPYTGASYAGAYAADRVAGVFVDRHAPDKRLFLLRSATLPAVLVETHHALDPNETVLFATSDAAERFGAALARALDAAL